MKIPFKTALFATAIAFAWAPAQATITITTDQQTDQGENILFGPTYGATTGTTVFGETQNGFGLSFTSTQNLLADGGQATISATEGDLTNLTIASTTAPGFEFIEFDLSNSGNGGTADSVTITGLDQFGNTYSQFFDGLTGGANFFFLLSDDIQYITSVSFTTEEGGFESVRQVRVGEYVGAPPAVPEPATWGMMLMGFGATGFAMRRRRRANRSISQLA